MKLVGFINKGNGIVTDTEMPFGSTGHITVISEYEGLQIVEINVSGPEKTKRPYTKKPKDPLTGGTHGGEQAE